MNSRTESRDLGPRCPECGSRDTITYSKGISASQRYKRCRACDARFKTIIETEEEGDTLIIRETPVRTENRGAGSRRRKRQSEFSPATV